MNQSRGLFQQPPYAFADTPDGSRKTCRSCRKPILWAVTDRQALMPIDVDPDPKHGNISTYVKDGTRHAVVFSKPKAAAMRAAKQPLHVAHFSTCPHAANWRRR